MFFRWIIIGCISFEFIREKKKKKRGGGELIFDSHIGLLVFFNIQYTHGFYLTFFF